MEFETQVARLTVEDDGRGFDSRLTADRRPPTSEGMGLTIMQLRAEALGGRLVVESAPGAGTRIVAELPAGDDSRPPTADVGGGGSPWTRSAS